MFAFDAPEIVEDFIVQLLKKREFDSAKVKEETEEEKYNIKKGKPPVETTIEQSITIQTAQVELNPSTKVKIISQFEYGQEEPKIGFLIDAVEDKTDRIQRQLISEEELLINHSKEMYTFIKSTLKFEKRVEISKKMLMSPNFEEELSQIMRNPPGQLSVTTSAESKTEDK
jgi:hypothetical protein